MRYITILISIDFYQQLNKLKELTANNRVFMTLKIFFQFVVWLFLLLFYINRKILGNITDKQFLCIKNF